MSRTRPHDVAWSVTRRGQRLGRRRVRWHMPPWNVSQHRHGNKPVFSRFPRNEELKAATHAHVIVLCVLPEYQGQGIGRRLLTTCRMAQTIFSTCRQLTDTPVRSANTLFGVSEVTLNVRQSNELAMGLYTSLGFYTTKTKPGFCKSALGLCAGIDGEYDTDPDGEDAFFMNLVLTDDIVPI